MQRIREKLQFHANYNSKHLLCDSWLNDETKKDILQYGVHQIVKNKD